MREFDYEARDKYALSGYLTMPAGAAEKNLPLVVMPHGGPEDRDRPASTGWSQFLASRGYAVLQPQFRGSTGLGDAHADAGRRQWGLRMQDDVTDGVKALITQGIVDPKRVCIVGWSYGGYAALAGAAFTPELYACAASIGGVSDLPESCSAPSHEKMAANRTRLLTGANTSASPIRPERHREVAGALCHAPCAHRYCCCMEPTTPWCRSRNPTSWPSAAQGCRKPVELIELTARTTG